jgi:hypothetical protein
MRRVGNYLMAALVAVVVGGALSTAPAATWTAAAPDGPVHCCGL